MTSLRVKMIHDMQLQRLAPKTQKAYIAAVAGLAKFYGCSPDHLRPDQIRSYLHHLLVERRLAWSSCTQVACGLKFFYVTTLGWDVLHLHLPPRTGRWLRPHLMSVEELQRLFTSAPTPRHRVLLMTTYAAGLRVGEVVRLQLTDIESDRRLIRVNQGKGRKDRYHVAVDPAPGGTPGLLAMLPPLAVALSGARSHQTHVHCQRAEDLLPHQAHCWDHPRQRHPYAAAALWGLRGPAEGHRRPPRLSHSPAWGHAERCPQCGFARYAYSSCRNRHCPKCQTWATVQWVEAQRAELLPTPYFHTVFTVPHALNALMLGNKRLLLTLLFRTASQTLLQFGQHNRGGQLGATLVLHTWDQTRNAHFHLHCLVPAGALAEDGTH